MKVGNLVGGLAFEDAIKAEVQKKLDDFAREKGYKRL